MAISLDIITPTLLESIRQHPNLPDHVWYMVAITVLAILNRPEEIPAVYKHVLDHGPGARNKAPSPEEQLTISQRIREALIKASTLGGLPKVSMSYPHKKK